MSPQQIRDSMAHEVGELPSAEQSRFIDAVIERVPQQTEVEKPVSAWVLVAANLVPLAGVLLWGWDAFALIALFWMENVIIGVFFVLRMLCADPRDPALWAAQALHGAVLLLSLRHVHRDPRRLRVQPAGRQALRRRRASQLLEPAARAAARLRPVAAARGAVASHLFSFCWNYLYRGEFRRAQLPALMTEPYSRVIVLHVTIILGGIGAMALGSPLWALLVLLARQDRRLTSRRTSKNTPMNAESEARRDPGEPPGRAARRPGRQARRRAVPRAGARRAARPRPAEDRRAGALARAASGDARRLPDRRGHEGALRGDGQPGPDRHVSARCLRKRNVAARGPKPTGALRSRGRAHRPHGRGSLHHEGDPGKHPGRRPGKASA